MKTKFLVHSLLLWFGLHSAADAAGCQTLSTRNLQERANAYSIAINSAASQHNVSPKLIKAIITVESCFRNNARGSAGEWGLMQLMPATAKRFGVNDGYNPWQNISGGTRYLNYLLDYYDGSVKHAIAAYNAGEGNVSKHGRIPNPYYVGKVMQAYAKFAGKTNKTKRSIVKKITKNMERLIPIALLKPASSLAGYSSLVTLLAAMHQEKPAAKVSLRRASLIGKKANGKAKTKAKGSAYSSTYIVGHGITLYEVMRRTNVPVKKLIALNQLSPPYHLKAGQVLRLR